MALSVRLFLALLLLAVATCAPPKDIMSLIPGYPKNYPTSIYSGYLKTTSTNRTLHYVFVESTKGTNNSDPVTLWLNGGPGCSSMLGFIQEIGPYYLEDGIDWKKGDNLTMNPYSWHNVSNLLFIESPAGVGYSYNADPDFHYHDDIVAQDTMAAVLDFFSLYPEYSKARFWITGESYAGKYIPDLAVLVDAHNRKNPINPVNFKGIMVGNGLMDWRHLEINEIQFYINHEFIDPELDLYWRKSCKSDPGSAGCGYFYQRFLDNTEEINPYSVYDYCYYNDSFAQRNPTAKRYHNQQSILKAHAKAMRTGQKPVFNSPTCAYFDGIFNYFNLNEEAFHAKFAGMQWDGPCSEKVAERYNPDPQGSMVSYRTLLTRISQYQIVIYNGDWDAMVPYIDTIENLKRLNLRESKVYSPWFTNGQHSGFEQLYSGVVFRTFKGAPHAVPQKKRQEAFEMFRDFVMGHQ